MRCYSATVALDLIHGCQSIPCSHTGPDFVICLEEPDLSFGDVVSVVVTVDGRPHSHRKTVLRVEGNRVQFRCETIPFFRR